MRQIVPVLLALAFLFVPAITVAQEAALTNDDVIKLVKLGLGDDVVLAKIRQASVIAFKLEPDDLGKLKAAGVSAKVITAMLDRAAPSSAPPPPPTSPPANELEAAYARMTGAGTMSGVVSVELIDSAGVRALPSQSGDTSSTNYVVGAIFWFNVNDAHAATRSSDKAAFIRVHTSTRVDEVGAFVKLDSNDSDRSLKIGSVNPLSFRGSLGFKVDKKWIIPSEVKEGPRGVWELRPIKPLTPGEYGFYTEGMRIFSFGVDK